MFSFGSAKSVVGLDIGSHSIKVANIKIGKEPQLSNFGIIPLPHDQAVVDGAIVDSPAVAEALKTFFKESKLKTNNVVASVSNQNIITRFIKVPLMGDDEMDEAIKYEAEQYVPYALEDMNLSYHKLGQVDDDGMAQSSLLLVCAQKEFVANFMATLKEAQIVPQVLDVDNLAIINSLEASIKPDEVTAIIDIGAASTNVNILKEGTLKFSRNIPIAGNNITSVIMNVMKLDFYQAEVIKKEDGSVSIDDDDADSEISEVVKTIIEDLASEISRSFDYYKAQFREQMIHRILLTGGTAKLPNIDNYFANELGVEVELGDPTFGLVSTVANPDQLQEHLLELPAAIGLALREAVS
jgi:type IV pilus assembly protein PilM